MRIVSEKTLPCPSGTPGEPGIGEGSVETQDSTQAELVESVVAAVTGEVRALAEWLVEHRAGDLREQ